MAVFPTEVRLIRINNCVLYVFKKLQVVYLQIPKAACTTIKWNLALAEGLIDEATPFHWVNAQKNLCGFWGLPEKYNNFFWFTFVRNPYDRLVSGWYDKIVDNKVEAVIEHAHPGVFSPGMTFPDFVRQLETIPDERTNGHFHSQTGLIKNNIADKNLHYIARVENFAVDWAALASHLMISPKSVWLNAKNRNHYRTYYNQETLDIVTKRFQNDLDTFGYLF